MLAKRLAHQNLLIIDFNAKVPEVDRYFRLIVETWIY